MPNLKKNIKDALATKITGEVITESERLVPYSTDQSMYKVEPLAACFPKNIHELQKVITFAQSENIPITARGKGSGTAGACLGNGIIVGFAKDSEFATIQNFASVNNKPLVSVGVGLIHKQLQDFLAQQELFLPADPSSAAISMLGGNLATKASGPHELNHGAIDRYVESLSFVTSFGTLIDTSNPNSIPHDMAQKLLALGETIRADLKSVQKLQKQQTMKCASGYQFSALLNNEPLPAIINNLLVGSIGTLGIITSAVLRIEPKAKLKAAALLFFKDLQSAGRAVPFICKSGASAVEITNGATISIIKKRHPELPFPDNNAHMLFVEYEGEECSQKINSLKSLLSQENLAIYENTLLLSENDEKQATLWKMRKEILPMILSFSQELFAPSLVNDVGIPVHNLAEFIVKAENIFNTCGVTAAIYGHAGSGNLHLRPLFRKDAPNLSTLFCSIADQIYNATLSVGGTITGEHGMGRLRAPYLSQEWGDTIMGYMKQVKDIFDPNNLLNPNILFCNRALLDEATKFPLS